MRNRVNILEKNFYVSEEKKTIACTIECDMQLERSGVDSVEQETLFKHNAPYGVFKVVAKAKCSDHDKFNRGLGMKIAESRAKKKMYKKASRIWLDICKDFERNAILCSQMAEACVSAAEVESSHVDELLK